MNGRSADSTLQWLEAIEIIRQSSDRIIFGSEEDPDNPILDN